MNRFFQHIGSLALVSVGLYQYSSTQTKLPPSTIHIHKELSSMSPTTALTTLAAVATGGFCYWNGIGFADIAYATRRSVENMSKQLAAVKVSLLNQIKVIENQLQGTEEHLDARIVDEAERLDARIVDEAERIRNNIEALHEEHRELSTTVGDIGKKVTRIELLTLFSSQGVALLCDAKAKTNTFFNNK